jgi:hypothetical protein
MNSRFIFIYLKMLDKYEVGWRIKKIISAMDVIQGKDFIEFYKNEK